MKIKPRRRFVCSISVTSTSHLVKWLSCFQHKSHVQMFDDVCRLHHDNMCWWKSKQTFSENPDESWRTHVVVSNILPSDFMPSHAFWFSPTLTEQYHRERKHFALFITVEGSESMDISTSSSIPWKVPLARALYLFWILTRSVFRQKLNHYIVNCRNKSGSISAISCLVWVDA